MSRATKRVKDMTPTERKEAREGLGLPAEHFAAHCLVTAPTIRDWDRGVEPRMLLPFKCYLEALQALLDEASEPAR